MRLALGVIFVVHGYAKMTLGDGLSDSVAKVAIEFGEHGIPFAEAGAWLAMTTELVGGICMIAGLLVRLWAIPVGFTMLVATLFYHRSAFVVASGGMEYCLVLLAVCVCLFLSGAGPFSLDDWLRRRKKKRLSLPN